VEITNQSTSWPKYLGASWTFKTYSVA